MKKGFTLGVLTLAFAAAACGRGGGGASDYARLMVGDWQLKTSLTQGDARLDVEAVSTYYEGGRMTATGSYGISADGQAARADYTEAGEWRIDGDALIEKKSEMRLSNPTGTDRAVEFLRNLDTQIQSEVGKETRYAIVALSAESITVRTPQGETLTMQRQ